MAGGTILLWAVAAFYATVFLMGMAEWARRGIADYSRRRRLSQPRVTCRVRVGR